VGGYPIHALDDCAGVRSYASLLFTVLLLLWIKLAELAHVVFVSGTNGIRQILDFRDELHARGWCGDLHTRPP
jgi:hypothetical protein